MPCLQNSHKSSRNDVALHLTHQASLPLRQFKTRNRPNFKIPMLFENCEYKSVIKGSRNYGNGLQNNLNGGSKQKTVISVRMDDAIGSCGRNSVEKLESEELKAFLQSLKFSKTSKIQNYNEININGKPHVVQR